MTSAGDVAMPSCPNSSSLRSGRVVSAVLLAVVALVAFFVLMRSIALGRLVESTPVATRPTSRRLLPLRFNSSERMVHGDEDRRDLLQPDEWVREYRLCQSDIATRRHIADHKPGQLYFGRNLTTPNNHNYRYDPGVCGDPESLPTAHRVGRGGYPEIRLTLTEADLRTIYGVDGLDAGNTGDALEPIPKEPPDEIQRLLLRLAPPLEVVIQVRAARFDPRRGEFVFTIWVERLYYDIVMRDDRDVPEGPFSLLGYARGWKKRLVNYLLNRARTVARRAAADGGLDEEDTKTTVDAASPFECAFKATNGRSMLRTTARRVYASDGRETMAAFRFACPYPLHPKRPPSTSFTFRMELRADKEWKLIAEIPPQRLRDQPVLGTASLRMCSRVERRVTFAYCSSAIYNDRNLPYLRSYIRHHTYLGVQIFHLYVRYDPAPLRDLLAEEIRVGLVQLHPQPESVYFYRNGHPQPYTPYLDQHLHQLECQSNHHESAKYLLNSDLDEYLYFLQDQPEEAHSPRPTPNNWRLTQYAATCLARTASGVMYFTGNSDRSDLSTMTPPPALYFLNPAAATASPGPISPTVYASLTHMPLGCRSMMGDMLVQYARPWAATSLHELPPGRLSSRASIPRPYPYPRTNLDMSAPFALPYAIGITDWPLRTENTECGDRREAAETVMAAASASGASCTLPATDWAPSASRTPVVCPLLQRFPIPVPPADVPPHPKSMYHTRAALVIEVHGASNLPSAANDPEPIFREHPPNQAVRWLHFAHMHSSAPNRLPVHSTEAERNATEAMAHRPDDHSPIATFHHRIMTDLEQLPDERRAYEE